MAAGRIARQARVDASNLQEISLVTLLKFEVGSDPDLRVGPVIEEGRKSPDLYGELGEEWLVNV